MHRYRKGKLIGQGTHGKVFRAVEIGSEQPVAIKEITGRAIPEIDITCRIKSPYLLQATWLFASEGHIHLVFPLALGDATCHEEINYVFDVDQMFFDVARGLWDLHQDGYHHFDIKPENILLFHDRAVLADFSLCKRTHPSDLIKVAYSERYRPPECEQEFEMSEKTEVYALGVTFFALATGHIYRPGVEFTPVSEWSRLIREMIHATPELRPTLQQVLQRCHLEILFLQPDTRPLEGEPATDSFWEELNLYHDFHPLVQSTIVSLFDRLNAKRPLSMTVETLKKACINVGSAVLKSSRLLYPDLKTEMLWVVIKSGGRLLNKRPYLSHYWDTFDSLL